MTEHVKKTSAAWASFSTDPGSAVELQRIIHSEGRPFYREIVVPADTIWRPMYMVSCASNVRMTLSGWAVPTHLETISEYGEFNQMTSYVRGDIRAGPISVMTLWPGERIIVEGFGSAGAAQLVVEAFTFNDGVLVVNNFDLFNMMSEPTFDAWRDGYATGDGTREIIFTDWMTLTAENGGDYSFETFTSMNIGDYSSARIYWQTTGSSAAGLGRLVFGGPGLPYDNFDHQISTVGPSGWSYDEIDLSAVVGWFNLRVHAYAGAGENAVVQVSRIELRA